MKTVPNVTAAPPRMITVETEDDGTNPRMAVVPRNHADMDFCVCVPADMKTYFDDNLIGECHDCGVRVQFRPYVPTELAKLCMGCFVKRTEGGREGVEQALEKLNSPEVTKILK